MTEWNIERSFKVWFSIRLNASINIKPEGGPRAYLGHLTLGQNPYRGAPKFGRQIRSNIPHLPTLDFLTKSELIISIIHTIPTKEGVPSIYIKMSSEK